MCSDQSDYRSIHPRISIVNVGVVIGLGRNLECNSMLANLMSSGQDVSWDLEQCHKAGPSQPKVETRSMETSLSFSGQQIAVTGGCSGIGLAIVRTLLTLNASVYIADLANELPLELASEEAIKFTGNCNVTHKTACKAFLASITGRLDGLVNCAGVCIREGPIASDEIYQLHMDVNVTGTWNMSTLALERMSQQEDLQRPGAYPGTVRSVGQGSVVNIGSGASLRGLPGLAPYCASKHAVLGLTRSWAKDFGKIRTNVVAPGMTDTPMATASMEGVTGPVINGPQSIPKGRMAYASDISDAVIYFLSDWSSFVTGQCLPVNGGNL